MKRRFDRSRKKKKSGIVKRDYAKENWGLSQSKQHNGFEREKKKRNTAEKSGRRKERSFTRHGPVLLGSRAQSETKEKGMQQGWGKQKKKKKR